MENCKLVIKDKSLSNVLGASEFDSYSDFESALPVGTEILVSDNNGHFITKFRKFSFTSDGKLEVLYDSPRGAAPINEVLGKVTTSLLNQYASALDISAKTRLVDIPSDTPPTTPEQQSQPIYDPNLSMVKMEQFESTTGQDVKSEVTGTLDERDSTVAKMSLRQAVANAPNKFRFFVVKDTTDYFNEEGVEATGEVLLTVHAAAYESLKAELGRELTQEELNTVAVRMDGERIVAEGTIYSLPLEGTLNGESQFFERNHQERLEAYADKYGTSIAAAEAHFRAGEERLKSARLRARENPVEVGLQSVSMGSFTNEPLTTDEFVSRNKLSGVSFFKNTLPGKVLGRIYLRATTATGQVIEMLTVPKGVKEMYGAEFVWDTYESGVSPEFISSLFGNNYRPKGPYLKNGVLHVQSRPVGSIDEFVSALGQSDWPLLSNKVGAGMSTLWDGSAFVEVPNQAFIEAHVETDGNLWTHKGKPVAYPANRYLYLNVSGDKPVERVTSSTENLDKAAQDLFRDPREYDRISVSNAPEDVAIRLMLPQFFSPAFLMSQSYPRLRKRLRFGPKQQGALSISYPVGGRYFGSKAVARRKMMEIVKSYADSGAKMPIQNTGGVFAAFENYINEKITQAQKDGIELGTFEPEVNALYTHFVNEFVAEVESGILFGNLSETHGISPEISPSYWQSQTEATSQSTSYTDLPETPTPIFRALNTELTPSSVQTSVPSSEKASENMVQFTGDNVTPELPNKIGGSGMKTLASVVSKDKYRPNLMGVFHDGGKMVATDGFELVVLTGGDPVQSGKLIDPKSGRVIDAKPVNYEAVIPEHEKSSVEIPILDLLGVFNGVSTETKSKDADYLDAVDVSFGGEIITMKPSGVVKLLSVFRANGSKTITIEYGSATKAVIFKSDNGNFGLSMPVFLNDRSSVRLIEGSIEIPIPSTSNKTAAGGIVGNFITLDAYRTLSKANGSWTSAQEEEYQEHIAAPNKVVNKKVSLAYAGPVNTIIDSEGTVQSFEVQESPVREFTVVGSDSELGRQMLSEGYSVATSEGKTLYAPYFFTPSPPAQQDAFLQSLEDGAIGEVERTPVYEYAENLLGKNFAQRLFSSGQPYTFADIEAFRADLGKPFSFTRLNARKDFAITPRSEAKIVSGDKTLTLRDSNTAYSNRSGLVEIDGEVFDIQELGDLDLKQALGATGMTQQEFAKAFLGDDTGIESIREEGVRAFFDGIGKRRVFTISKLGTPVNPRRRKSKKSLPC